MSGSDSDGRVEADGLHAWFDGRSGIVARLASDGTVLDSNRGDAAAPRDSLAAHFALEAVEPLAQVLQQVAADGQPRQVEASVLGADGVRRWYWLNIGAVRRDGVVIGYGVHGVDITARKREEDRLRRSESMLVDTQGVAHLGVWEWDITEPHAVWSPELYRIYGETPQSYTPTYEGYLAKVHPDDRQRVMDATNEVFHHLKPYSHDERIYRADGELRYLHTWAFPVLDDAGKLIRLTGVCQDITDRKRAELERDRANELALSAQRLALHRAQYDELTRLPNRSKFGESLHEALANGAARLRRFALVTLGLDHFSELNHALGPRIGDSVLSEVAERLRRALPDPSALLARTGPDLFSWIAEVAEGADGVAQLQKRCEALRSLVGAPLELGQGVAVSASLGCALYPDHADSAEQLLYASDTALHWAKKHARGFLKIYESSMQQRASRVLELNRELHRAMASQQLRLHYQPIMTMTGARVLGVEALARWRRDDGSQIPPDHFIPVAESGDLLRPFTEWTIGTVCAQMADWLQRGVPVPRISFNLSAAQLRLAGIDQYILDEMRRRGLQGSALAIEITEEALLDNLDAAGALLTRLRQEGLAVAVDDFGVGYSSPHYLRSLPINILKIDGSFLKDVPGNADATSLLNGIIEIGHSLQMQVVTECVEHAEQAAYLRRLGGVSGQGFWFTRALPADELEQWLTQWLSSAVVAVA
ncbi:EAL domain-containing protein [Fontimonas sp. SYSU GA230001]|uniref:putative bifunctional diguanylate cyclase/phosphodiesterase n=1 Tax=Fontimonas sp. SYSU GA230001 TaxID=3142450 RepID=UPI0032B5FD66